MKSQFISGILFLILTLTAACSSSDDGNETQVTPTGNIDPELVGNWVGEVDGSFGKADMTMTLRANGTVSTEGSTALYCPVDGKWEVAGTEFKVTGKDDCDGSSVNFLSKADKTSMKGTWNASSGNNGTFSIVKQ